MSASGDSVRALMRSRPTASLATVLVHGAGKGWPYASLVLVAMGHDAAPLLLISRLAEHTKNIAADARVSLLFDGSEESRDRLAGSRVTVLGRAARSDDPLLKSRFVARHPEAAGYAGFGDFSLYRVSVESAHLVGGFGRIEWLTADDIRFDVGGAESLAAAEARILEKVARDGMVPAIAKSAGLAGADWSVTGVDPEGLDLRSEGTVARVAFAKPARTEAEVHAAVARLTRG